MKNIETLMADFSIEMSEENKTAFVKAVNENYKTIAEVEKKDEKVKTLTEKLAVTEDALKKFDGVDAEGLKAQIADLNKALADKDTEYQKKISDRDFNDLLKESITNAKGKNPTAIMALLDIDTLKASKNQKVDIDNAIKALTESKDSDFMFEKESVGGRNPIGSFNRTVAQTTTRDDKYKDNPFYHPKQ